MNHEETLFNIIFSCRKAQLLYTAARLKLSDILADGPKTSDEIAEITHTNKDALYRLMRALAGMGLYKKADAGRFELTPMGGLLKKSSKSGVRINALFQLDEMSWRPWGELLYSVKTGKNAFEKIFGASMFDYLSQHPEKSTLFSTAFKTYTSWWVDSFLGIYDFSPYQLIADIGGSAGIFIKTILEHYPEKKGILFDLPNVIGEIQEEFSQYEIAGRCTLVRGDFFTTIPGGCDLYLLKNIIHDWGDEHALRILNNCHKAMGNKSRILLLENVIKANENISPDTFIIDISMLVGTTGGRERTEEEYRALLSKAGFTPGTITGSYVEGIKSE